MPSTSEFTKNDMSRSSDTVLESARLAAQLLLVLRLLENSVAVDPMLQGMLEVLVEYPEEDQSRLHSDLPPVEIHEPLCQPQRWIVATDVVGVDYRYLKAKSNDHVIVYGWKRGNRDAVAFNERNHSSGWIPSQYLHSKESVQARGESFVARQNLRSKPESNQYLQWKVGERIRVCHWINRKSYRGIGYNLKTGQIGQFAISDWNCAVEDDT